ncbi:response regulator transcription factor [Nitrosophilus labii]|uniref:response regulator transcription factor n=1 Tax=Nitrosophilus labii TaxID=2706014 RepID=UPI001657153C|nr:response regulator transcription factor [Nitrosophilus labii]
MTIENAIKKSELVSIEGENKSGKLTFSLFITANIFYDNSLVMFSSFPKSLMLKRLSAIAYLGDKKVANIINSMNILCLKENFKELKRRFGYKFMIEDIKRVIEKDSCKTLLFHRLDLFFEIQERDDAEQFIEELIEIKELYDIKLLITSSASNNPNNFINEILENYTDMNLYIEKENRIEIKVQSSIFPVQHLRYLFQLENKTLKLKPLKENETSNLVTQETQAEKPLKKILLISQDTELINLHRFLFDRESYIFDTASSLSETIQKILEGPDLIIYNPPDESYDLEVCTIIKNNNLRSKLIYIVNKEYVRQSDKMNAINAGCYEIFSKNFIFEEYILTLERIIQNHFYTTLIQQLPNNMEIIKNLQHFCNIIDGFWHNRIYASIISAKTNISKEILFSKIREKDIMFYDEKRVIFCLISLRKEIAKTVIDKMKAFTDETKENFFETEHIIDTTIWKEHKEEICKK